MIRMEKKEKQIFKGLKFYIRNDRVRVDYLNSRRKLPISNQIINMMDTYVNFGKYDKNIHDDEDHYTTHNGLAKFDILRSEYRESFKAKLTIANLIMFVANLILFTKSIGWW